MNALAELDGVAITRDPVCGMIIDPEAGGSRYSHDGHIYHFCAELCLTRFESDPEAYKTAKDPVCGMDVDRATAKYVSKHAGGRDYFCSERCKAKFDADPDAYADGRP